MLSLLLHFMRGFSRWGLRASCMLEFRACCTTKNEMLMLCMCYGRLTVSNWDPPLGSLRVQLHATQRRQAATMHYPSIGKLDSCTSLASSVIW